MKVTMCFLLMVVLVVLAVPVVAAEGDVLVGQSMALRLRAPAGGMTVQQRADIVYSERILPLLGSDPFDAKQMAVKTVGGDTCIFYGDKLIVVVDPETARANSSTPANLANVWAFNLANAIADFKALTLSGNTPTL